MWELGEDSDLANIIQRKEIGIKAASSPSSGLFVFLSEEVMKALSKFDSNRERK